MDRLTATNRTRSLLDKHNLKDWGVRISTNVNIPFVGLCSYKDKVIILNAHHIDIHPDSEVEDTILHEIAHAIVGGIHQHDLVWLAKAKELGCSGDINCSMSMPPAMIDAIRSGNLVEVETEEQVIKVAKYTVTRLQDMCPDCLSIGKRTVAEEVFSVDTVDTSGNIVKLITLKCFHIIKRITPKGTPFETMVSNDWKDDIKNCKHNFPTREVAKHDNIPPNQCTKCGEYKLYDFQITGARAAELGLSQQKGFGIFDDMGLGKTVMGLAIPKFHPLEYTPFLAITKSAITYQWFKQIIRWLGPDYMPQIIRTGKDYLMPGLKSYVVAYDLLRRFDREKLFKLGIKLVLLDECQQIKNPDSSRTQEVRRLVSNNPETKVLPLSGTPWKNRGSEFFPVLNIIDPYKFSSYQGYLDTWVDYYYQGAKRKMSGIKNVKRFKEYTSGLLIRREYNEVMDEFPEINRMKLPVQLDELQQDVYDGSESEFVAWYNDHVIGGTEDSISGIELIGRMARMRHITGLAKIPATLGYIEEYLNDTDRKLVVFVQHKDVGQLMYDSLKGLNSEYKELADALTEQSIPVFSYHSGLSDSERFEMQQSFNNARRAFMIASTLACGEGVDLQSCADCIMHERQWNPQNEDQAAPGRFRRIGQLAKVINITVPEAEGTIDEHLDMIVSSKRLQFHEVMNKGEAPQWNESEIVRELASKIVSKHKTKKAKSGAKPNTNSLTSLASM